MLKLLQYCSYIIIVMQYSKAYVVVVVVVVVASICHWFTPSSAEASLVVS